MEVGSGGRWRLVAEVGGGRQRRSVVLGAEVREVGSGGRWRSVAEVDGGR